MPSHAERWAGVERLRVEAGCSLVALCDLFELLIGDHGVEIDEPVRRAAPRYRGTSRGRPGGWPARPPPSAAAAPRRTRRSPARSRAAGPAPAPAPARQ